MVLLLFAAAAAAPSPAADWHCEVDYVETRPGGSKTTHLSPDVHFDRAASDVSVKVGFLPFLSLSLKGFEVRSWTAAQVLLASPKGTMRFDRRARTVSVSLAAPQDDGSVVRTRGSGRCVPIG
ncbi:hypothetical protein ABDK56_04535 [Sphingomonas sp. ASV193]|uniref:hypothetical protein n=1 Tax=Sphingomonas sp. ASV193 TaxID=3144405 RepID=UPI0032E88930